VLATAAWRGRARGAADAPAHHRAADHRADVPADHRAFEAPADHRVGDAPADDRSGGLATDAAGRRTEVATGARLVLRALGLAAGVGVLALAALGPAEADRNPAARLVLVVCWAGLVPLSLVAPGAWRALSPLRAATALLARLSGDPGERGVRALPAGLGWWPGVGALAGVAVVEGPLRGDPTALLVFLVAYALVQIAAAAVYGSAWYAHAEAFEIVAALVGRLSPVARGQHGRWGLASPLPRLGAPLPPGGVAVVGLLVGAALADFAADTAPWGRLTVGRAGAVETGLDLALLVACAALAIALLRAAGPLALRPAVAPLATAYLFAHYFAILLIEGQAAVAQLANLARGDTGLDISVNYDLLPGPLAASAQLLGFLAPHVVAAVVASDLAAARYGRRAGAAAATLVGVLALSAVGGTALRYSGG